MTGAYDEVAARLRALVIDGDLAVLRAHLDSLSGADLAAARRWAKGTHDVDVYPYPDELGDEVIETFEGGSLARVDVGRPVREAAMHRARLLTYARLAGPAAAVKAVGGRFSRWDDRESPALVAAFVDHDRAWAAAFATAADAVSPSARGAWLAYVLLRAVVEAHELPVPTGTNFHEAWIRRLSIPDDEGLSPAHHLRQDPLLPDVVYHQLASGESGHRPELPRALPPLVTEGLLDRDRVLAVALDQLTAGQRPSSQRVLAGVLTALELRPDEVPGGLDYLMSVLSTCHGSAAGVVLGLALDLVASDIEAVELARVLAPRPEKGLRRTLLAALSPTRLGTRIDHQALLEAIDVLSAGDEDVTAGVRYEQARAALGFGPTTAPSTAPTPLGLWDLSPRLPDRRPVPRFALPLRDVSKQLMRTGAAGWHGPEAIPCLIDAALRGELTTLDLLATAYELTAEGRLSPARTATVLEALFLGGAMQVAWPAALRIADLAATGARSLPGLDRLLAMLTSYAGEPPGPVQLPPHLVRLSKGTSKAALESRRLAELLGSSTEEIQPAPVHLGLWDEEIERPPWGLAYPPVRSLETLGIRLASGAAPEELTDLRHRVRHILLLEELTTLVVDLGVEEVRAGLGGTFIHTAHGSAEAVAVWVAGALTPELYWRLAESAVAFHEMSAEWQDAQEHRYHWRPEHGIDLDPPVMPRTWSWNDWALEFLHACEVLLLVERGGHLVSSPDRVDGTLGLGTLLERLATSPRVGPLDLRLALSRLRPFAREQADQISGSAPIDAGLTSPEGGEEMDAFDVVRSWVAAGGMRVVAGPASPMSALPSFEAVAPTPWNALAALSTRKPFDDLPSFRGNDVWRLPGRADAWLRGGLHHDRHESLADVGGSLGQEGWEILFQVLGTRPSDHATVDLGSLVRLSRQGRLDPAVAAAAATWLWDNDRTDVLGDAVGWEQSFLRGALRGMWPVAVAVVEAGRARADRPAGIDRLLDILRRYAHEVPADAVPALLAET